MDGVSQRLIRGYQIGERVSADEFSVTYRAYQAAIERDVALRVILPPLANQPGFIQRFELEAQLIARLEHPHILPLYDYWREPEGAFLAMRWLPASLQTALQRGVWSPEAAARLLEQVAEALTSAHREGILHRRLTPGSIRLDEDENAYLTDFGIGEPVEASPAASDVNAGGAAGCWSPEQTRGEPFTVRTNVYHLGAIAYELLTGHRPGPPDADPPRPPRLPVLPVALNEVLQTATASDPMHRYGTVLRFAAAFRAAVPIVQRAPLQPLAEPLTERELDILRLVVADRSNAQIAQTLVLSPGTVKWYVQQLYRKLEVHSRRQAIDRARQLNLAAVGLPAPALDRNPAPRPTAAYATRAAGANSPVEQPVNPYKGLRAFHETDAADFFGRAALTEQLLARLVEGGDPVRFLAVVGPSGSGKSSVVRAGLIPALRRGALPNSDRWFITDMVPGTRPLEELELALLRVSVGPMPGLLSQLSDDRRSLVHAARRILPAAQDVELFLLIDQFEELFTLVADEAVRAHFIANLLSAVADPRSRVRVVVTLRADFYDRPLLYPRLAELMRSHTEVVVPLTAAELERAIAGPAEREGLTLEPGLVATMVRDVAAQPGGLPLLQYALTELFERRADATLRTAAYEAGGGLSGALARRAEELYAELAADGQAVTRQVFLRLVRLGETGEDTRRRVHLAELEAGLHQPRVLDEVMAAFDRYRLLTFDRDPITRAPTVELAHEALLRAWQRLADWIAASRRDLQIQHALAIAARQWADAQRDRGLLATGTRLAQFEALAAEASLLLSAPEHAYIAASLAERARSNRENQARDRLVTMLRRGLTGLLAVALVVTVGLLVFALSSRNAALAQEQIALARQLAVQAVAQLQNPVGNDELAALLAVRSLNIQYSAEADQALLQAAEHLPLRQFAGHTDEVYAAVFSPDGQTVLTVSADQTAKLWDAATGRELLTLNGHTDEVIVGAFAPDGKQVVTGSADHTAIVWDAATGRALRSFAAGTDEVHGVAFSPDGRYLLTGNYDNSARLWEAATGQVVANFLGHTDSIKSVAFSPDGASVLTGSSDGTAKLWDAGTGRALRTFAGHTDAVYSVAFSPDGRWVATGSPDNTAKIWEASTGRLVLTLAGHTGSVQGLAFSPDSQLLVTASGDNTARLWRVSSGELLETWRGHLGRLWTAAFSPDGQWVLTSSNDRTAKLWAVSGNPIGVVYRGHEGPVYDVAFSPDGQWLATAGADRTARLWEAATGRLLRTFSGHAALLNSLAFSPDGHWLLTTSNDHTAKIWDALTGRLIWTLADHSGPVMAAAFSPDGSRALTSSGDHTARLWDPATGQAVHTFTGHTEMVWDAAFSPDGLSIVTGSVDRTIRVWDATTYAEISTWIAGPNSDVNGLTFSPDGRFILAAADPVRLWEIATGQPVRTFSGHTHDVHQVAVSPDGRYFLTSSEDQTAIIWDAATGQEVRTLSGHTGAVWGLAFSPDGHTIVTGSDDGTARSWSDDYHELVTAACLRLLRDLTQAEQSQVHLDSRQPTCAQPSPNP